MRFSLKLKSGALKRNGKGSVIDACVFTEFHSIKYATRHKRREQGFATANEVVSNCFDSAIPTPRFAAVADTCVDCAHAPRASWCGPMLFDRVA